MNNTSFRIAAISVSFNDGYKLQEWHNHYEGYKDELYMHIIVDNGSHKPYLNELKSKFKDSVIIERSSNGGSIVAFNEGIRYAMLNPNVQYIALIDNDVRLAPNALTECACVLSSVKNIGMVSPILLDKDSTKIQDFGSSITPTLFMDSYMKGRPLSDVQERIHYADAVMGGVNLASKEFYLSVGMQDERLFMYSDEVDMGIRARALGYKLASLSTALSWHQHINLPNRPNVRHPYSEYLIGRNKVYLARKHFGNIRAFIEFIYIIGACLYTSCRLILLNKGHLLKDQRWRMLGAINGIVGNMEPNRFSHL